MPRLLKTLLLWLLIAALPVQAMAAVVKAACGPEHHAFQSVVLPQEHSQRLHPMQALHHEHDKVSHSHHHDHAGNSPAMTGHGVADSTMPDAGTSHAQHIHDSGYCSACAACCTGAAAPPSALSPPLSYGFSEAVVISSPIPFTGHIPAGLERPPKPVFA